MQTFVLFFKAMVATYEIEARNILYKSVSSALSVS